MTNQVLKGWVPNDFEYISNQPHIKRTTLVIRESFLKKTIEEIPVDLLGRHIEQQRLLPVVKALKAGDRIKIVRIPHPNVTLKENP